MAWMMVMIESFFQQFIYKACQVLFVFVTAFQRRVVLTQNRQYTGHIGARGSLLSVEKDN